MDGLGVIESNQLNIANNLNRQWSIPVNSLLPRRKIADVKLYPAIEHHLIAFLLNLFFKTRLMRYLVSNQSIFLSHSIVFVGVLI